ncbi:ParB/RepB/Spo0J family partition protein [Saccharothrix longispora]|uniref:ParB family chromosome partitioning protein n=1 Tax=Saccharothrix longispora TaxID=33920 RepID=A0ABU1PUJ8_9PSEU|nr:ParB/RepB/Spo0J family partition protein [Saccharothrix longispora]MDR6593564.1 ParB family chromosome partitioning protein [Saccharothrix longispora]
MTVNVVAERDTIPDSAPEGSATVEDAMSVAAPPEVEVEVEVEVEPAYPYLKRGVDPRELRAQGNTREVGDIRLKRPELVASVTEHGLNPMVSIVNVAPDPVDGALRVLVGFHRTAAAIAVKELENPELLIDVLVHAPGTTRDVLVAQGIENIHREGYTQAEEAGLYQQLSLSGMGEAEIAQTLTRKIERVQAGLAVASNPRTRAASEALPGTDLLTMAQLAEFDGDEQAHQTLLEVLTRDPRNFEWTLGQLRRERAQRATLAEEVARFTGLGYAIVESTSGLPEDCASLDELCTGEDATALDPTGHGDCPGRAVAVWVDRDLEVEVTHFCAEFTRHGHHTIASVKIAQVQERLRADGVPVVDPDTDGVAYLDELLAAEHAERALTATEHAGCPGHAACVEHEYDRPEPDIHYVCTDYTAHGHVLRTARTARPEPDSAFKAGERKRAEENNKRWRDAKTDRRAWLRKYFAERTSPKLKAKDITLPARVHHWLGLADVLAGDYLSDAAPLHRYACTLLTLGESKDHRRELHPITVQLRRKDTTEPRAILIRLALVVGACEQHWDLGYTDKSADASWRRPSEDTRFYFALLDALGYPLSHIEQLVNNPELDHDKWPHLVPADIGDAPAA